MSEENDTEKQPQVGHAGAVAFPATVVGTPATEEPAEDENGAG